MDYFEVEQARAMPGLKLVLTRGGVPAPWSESAKHIFRHKSIPFIPVVQRPGKPNEELVAWTGSRNAPIAIHESASPRANWLDILSLAERLRPQPALVPSQHHLRIQVFGLAAEICSEGGFGWSRRLMMLSQYAKTDAGRASVLASAYEDTPENIARAPQRCGEILDALAARLNDQESQGSPFLVGDAYSAGDLYWACFSQMVAPLPPDLAPTHPAMFASYANIGPKLAAHLDPILLQHRDFIYRDFIGLPLDW
jgi:glutathione S-transferase